MQNDINPDRRVVVILGMDRTGTSLCTNVLNKLGMRLSSRLLPPDQFNQEGYFEDPEIFQAHVQILAALDRSWETLETIHPYPSRWWESPSMDPFRDALVDIVRRRSDEGPGVWGFKDPRTAALMPLWNEVFRICGVRPAFVLCVRHPAATARSLFAREMFSLLFSELLWFEKTLSGCLAIQNAPHCLIQYEEWFKDPRPQTRMLREIAGLEPAGTSAEIEASVSSIVNSGLRHQDGGAIISRAARDLYAHLIRSAKVPEPGVLMHFDFACEVGREYFSDFRHMIGKRHHAQWALLEDRNHLMDRCQAAEREIAAMRASATWRWSQNALGSWPARRLLGPIIRAVAGHRG